MILIFQIALGIYLGFGGLAATVAFMIWFKELWDKKRRYGYWKFNFGRS